MKDFLKVGDKIGYLSPYTGRYKYVEIVDMTDGILTMCEVQKVGNRPIPNIYKEETKKVLRFFHTPSEDFKDGRPVLKHKSTKSNFVTEAHTLYNKTVKQ